jgi:Fe-S-cluster containining protein
MNEVKDQSISECKRCGTCCMQGGPSLHLEDKNLLANGPIKLEHLITIRKGEMAHFALHDEPVPIMQELIKIAGKGKEWECTFLEHDEKLCTIYEHRPLECRLLECWNTSELENVVGQNTLTRADIIASDNPINEFIRLHELKCPIPEPYKIRTALSSEEEGAEALAELTELVHRDLAVRAEAVGRFNISLPLEILYFGRPIHIILNAHGLCAIEKDGIIHISKQDKRL